MKKRVFITRRILSDGPDFLRSKGYEVDVFPDEIPLTYDELLYKAADYDALITMLSDRIDDKFLQKNAHLKAIANYAVGYNNIDIVTASKLGIPVGNTPGVLTEATAETALGLMISAARNFNHASLDACEGRWKNWEPMGHLGHSLSNKTLGCIGFGRIGSELAHMASLAFKMNVIYTARTDKQSFIKSKRVDLDELLAKSDFISLHVPLTAQTHKLISEREFALMKKNAVLINTSRGEVIDQEALVKVLKEKRIFGCGLDVTDPEPLDPNHELFQIKNCLILPHIGSATFEARRAMSLMAAENIHAGLEGLELKTWVNKKEMQS